METQEVLKNLRDKYQLMQEELAARALVTRQAVSHWETGETQPNMDTLKLPSKEFNISISTLLGSPRQLICQCCGIPLTGNEVISRGTDGNLNEDYCKWCYVDGVFAYTTKDSLFDYLMANMPDPDNLSDEGRRLQFDVYLPQLGHWKQNIEIRLRGYRRV